MGEARRGMGHSRSLGRARDVLRLATPSPPPNHPVGWGNLAVTARTSSWRSAMGSVVKYDRTLFEPEHDLFRESYRAFLDRHVAPYHEQWEQEKIVDLGAWLEAGHQAFLGMAGAREKRAARRAHGHYDDATTQA